MPRTYVIVTAKILQQLDILVIVPPILPLFYPQYITSVWIDSPPVAADRCRFNGAIPPWPKLMRKITEASSTLNISLAYWLVLAGFYILKHLGQSVHSNALFLRLHSCLTTWPHHLHLEERHTKMPPASAPPPGPGVSPEISLGEADLGQSGE